MLSDGDRQWLETKFRAVEDSFKEVGSKVHKLDGRVQRLEDGSPHKCEEAVKAHEEGAWSHNPKMAIGLGASIVAIIGGARAFFDK